MINDLTVSPNVKSKVSEIELSSKFVRMSPSKVRRVLDQIRGCSYNQALQILNFMSYKASRPVIKLIKCAGSNLEYTDGISRNQLFIKTAYVNKGPTMKRFQPRAKGRGFPIQKPTCHIHIILSQP
jgi:large subunit ribosomal protein L22